MSEKPISLDEWDKRIDESERRSAQRINDEIFMAMVCEPLEAACELSRLRAIEAAARVILNEINESCEADLVVNGASVEALRAALEGK